MPVEITENPVVRVDHFRGGTTSISCSSSGLPVPTIVWIKDDNILTLSERVFVVENSSSDALGGNITSTLIFNGLELSDNASYYCVANNTGAPGNEFIVESESSFVFVTRKF